MNFKSTGLGPIQNGITRLAERHAGQVDVQNRVPSRKPLLSSLILFARTALATDGMEILLSDKEIAEKILFDMDPSKLQAVLGVMAEVPSQVFDKIFNVFRTSRRPRRKALALRLLSDVKFVEHGLAWRESEKWLLFDVTALEDAASPLRPLVESVASALQTLGQKMKAFLSPEMCQCEGLTGERGAFGRGAPSNCMC
jgi:hypothetical protein